MILVVQPQSTTIHQPSTHIIIKMSTTASSSLHDSKCANCGKGKESSGDLRHVRHAACKIVKYCTIAISRVSDCTVLNIKRCVRNVLLSCMIKNCSKSHHHRRSAQFVCYHYHTRAELQFSFLMRAETPLTKICYPLFKNLHTFN